MRDPRFFLENNGMPPALAWLRRGEAAERAELLATVVRKLGKVDYNGQTYKDPETVYNDAYDQEQKNALAAWREGT